MMFDQNKVNLILSYINPLTIMNIYFTFLYIILNFFIFDEIIQRKFSMLKWKKNLKWL